MRERKTNGKKKRGGRYQKQDSNEDLRPRVHLGRRPGGACRTDGQPPKNTHPGTTLGRDWLGREG